MEIIVESFEPYLDKKKLKEREEWLKKIKLDFKEEMLFELEVLLKSLDRFFKLENLPLNSELEPFRTEFHEELEIIHHALERALYLSRRLLESAERSFYQFRHYVETELLKDSIRTESIETTLKQENPMESLMLLYVSFLNLRSLTEELLKLPQVQYPLFHHIGNLVSKTIISNRYFNPTGGVQFRPEYDRVGNRIVQRVVKGLEDQVLKKYFSMTVLAFYRLLHYLSFIDTSSDEVSSLRSSILYFALINSESRFLLTEFMEREIPSKLKNGHPLNKKFGQLIDSLAFQLKMELKKINQTELLGATKQDQLDALRTAVENSHGILNNFLQQSIVQMVQLVRPEVSGEEIFTAFVSRRRQSLKIREEIWVFRELMDKFEEITESTIEGASLLNFMKYLKLQQAYIKHFKKEAVPLLRYGDLVEFRKYFQFVENLTTDDLHMMDKLEKFKMESKFFKIFLETTVGQINQRTELQGLPLDQKACREKLKLFIARQTKGEEDGLG